jgi:hypothetical protein
MEKTFNSLKRDDKIYLIKIGSSTLLYDRNGEFVRERTVRSAFDDCFDEELVALTLSDFSIITVSRSDDTFIEEPTNNSTGISPVIANIYATSERRCIEATREYLKKRNIEYNKKIMQLEDYIIASVNVFDKLDSHLEFMKDEHEELTEEFAEMALA